MRDLLPHVPQGVHLIPGHPIAGTEQSGPDAGFAELFDGRWCILTSPPGAERDATQRLTEFCSRPWAARSRLMDANIMISSWRSPSHVPHLIAYNIVGTAADLETVTTKEVIKYSAGGFRDFARASPLPIRPCGATSFSTTARRCSKCSAVSPRISPRFNVRSDGATAKCCSSCSRARAPFAVRVIDAGQDSAIPDFGRAWSTPVGARLDNINRFVEKSPARFVFDLEHPINRDRVRRDARFRS